MIYDAHTITAYAVIVNTSIINLVNETLTIDPVATTIIFNIDFLALSFKL